MNVARELPFSGIMRMLKSSVFFHGLLRGYKTGDKADVCLLPQSPISLHHPIRSGIFVTTSSFMIMSLVSHQLQEKNNK